MIALITEEADQASHDVLDWILHYYNRPAWRINSEKFYFVTAIDNDISLCNSESNVVVDLKSIKAVWYRRGYVHIEMNFDGNLIAAGNNRLTNHFEGERETLQDYVMHRIQQRIVVVGNFFSSRLNKLVVTEYASELGLTVPRYIITGRKSNLISFFDSIAGEIISKPLSDVIYLHDSDRVAMTYTTVVTDLDVDEMPDFFTTTLFQERIKKRFEIRVFHFRGVNYAMAIFSQNDPQTEVDFRRYNEHKPNRTVPINLPVDIGEKIKCLMSKLRLDSGSVDLIYDLAGRFVFLEVNPVGQFGMVSIPCNYHLEHKIAEALCSTN